jgi:hypothetical protein
LWGLYTSFFPNLFKEDTNNINWARRNPNPSHPD